MLIVHHRKSHHDIEISYKSEGSYESQGLDHNLTS